jgi:branched-chain amino acid transport system permease protein
MVQILYQFAYNFSFLVLAAMGLAIIFGMMGIINLAHGEFMMLGALLTVIMCAKYQVPFFIATLISGVIIGLFGLIIDRLIISHLYSRILDSVVVTWGISMIIKQMVSIWSQKAYGNQIPGILPPFGTIQVGYVSISVYRILLFIITIVIVIAIYWLFNHTKFGLKSRATMQNSQVSASLGVNTGKIYASTFATGSFLAGLAGGLFSPLITVSATFGSTFMMPSFVTVLVGGANPLIGTVLAGITLAGVKSIFTGLMDSLFGEIAMLVFAIVFIRFFPKGFSNMVDNISQKIALNKKKKKEEKKYEE